MKKIIITFIIVCLLLVHIPLVKAENKVKVYMFTKNGCPACEKAKTYFNGLLKENPDLFELVEIEVWYGEDENNRWLVASQELLDLMKATLDYHGEDTERLSTPTIAVGDYLQIGAGDLEKFEDRIKNFQTQDDYVDVVQKIATENNVDLNKLDELMHSYQAEEPENNYDIYILIGIFVFLIGGFGALYVFGRKK